MATSVEEKAKQFTDIRTVLLTSLISAFGFVLALFWNEAVKAGIEQVVPTGDTVTAKFITAIIVTVIVVVVIYLLVKSQTLAERRLQELLKEKKQDGRSAQERMRRRIIAGSS